MASGIRMRSRSDYPIDVRDDKNVPDEFTPEQKEIMFGAWLHKACELAPAQAVYGFIMEQRRLNDSPLMV